MAEVVFNAQTFADFLGRYADFMWEMCDGENEMLAAVARGDIPAMEHGMNMSSANQMRMAKFEADRQALQAAAGCPGCTLRQVIDTLDADERAPLAEALGRFEAGAMRLRFLNEKAMETTRAGLAELDEREKREAAEAAAEARAENPDGAKPGAVERSI